MPKLAKVDPAESNKVFIGGVPAHTSPESGSAKVFVNGKPIIVAGECTHVPQREDNKVNVFVG